jgi:hypothetical protein
MIVARPKNQFLLISCGRVKRLRLAAVNTLMILFAALLFSGAVEFAVAQDIFGRIVGTITDASGAAVPGANIKITNEATQVTREIASDKSGYYVADTLPVGNYTVSAELKGFKVSTKTGNVLVAGGHLTVDLVLQVGVETESVTVSATGDTINTTSGEISTTVDFAQLQSQALNQRHYETLVTLMPGAMVNISDPTSLLAGNIMSTGLVFVNGQRNDGMLYAVDGGFNMDSGSNNSAFNDVGIDFIREVDVQSSNFSAEYGRSASAQVNVVTRSGGNQFHGAAFEYLRNQIFDAGNAGTKLVAGANAPKSVLKPPLRYNDWGWDVGGPIKRDRLFFFAGQEWKRLRAAQSPTSMTLPTRSEVTGDFSDILPGAPGLVVPGNPPLAGITLKTPANAPPGCTIVNNVMSPACITPDGQAIAQVYALAAKRLSAAGALPTSVQINNTLFQPGGPTNYREDIIRVDFHASDKHNLFFRYIHDNVQVYNAFSTFGSNVGGFQLPVDPDLRNRPGYNYQIGWVSLVSPRLVNEVKFNADWHKQKIPPVGDLYLRSTYGFQFTPPLGFVGSFPTGIPTVTFTGSAAAPTSGPNGWQGPSPDFLLAPTADISPADNVTLQVRNHTLKFGALYARNRKNQNSRPTSYDGSLSFTPNGNIANTTNDAFADALMGNFGTFSQVSGDPIGFYRFNVYETYADDSWKLTRKLSLELGLRFELTNPTYLQGNNMTNFDPSVYNPANAPFVAANGALNTLGTPVGSGPGICTGSILPNSIPILIGCNGLVRPGGVPSDQQGRVPLTYQDPSLLAAIPATAPRGFYKPESLWAPRVGFAYSPFGNKTVIRGGFGIFYDKPEANTLGGVGLQGQPPWVVKVSTSNGQLSTFDTGTGMVGTVAPTATGVTSIDPHLKVARSMQYSLSVQREMPFGILAQAAYVGNEGRHILRGPNINAPTWTAANLDYSVNPAPDTGLNNPPPCPTTNSHCLATNQIRPYLGWTDIPQERSDATSNYNSLQLSATKRKGLVTASLSYTYSKAMGEDGGVGDAYNQNPEPECPFSCLLSNVQTVTWKQYEYGKVSFDRTHIFAVSYTLEEPWFRKAKGIEGGVLSGWQLIGATHFQSGAPLTLTGTAAVGPGGLGFSRRASIKSGVPLYSGYTCPAGKKCWFNPNAFQLAPNTSAGNAPIGSIIGPGLQAWDMTLRKTFGLRREGMNLVFEASAFNVFNHANWGNPSTSANSTGGQITSAAPARQVQFGAKFNF